MTTRSGHRQDAEYKLTGLGMRLQGVMQIDVEVHGIPIRVMYTIAEMQEGAILGMHFLVRGDCILDIGRPLLRISERVWVH